ncbi:MAG: BrnA antitoxin family protein [Gemmatimonadetes bacterium]|nr:BrnA antitoxin family protein [Gemmatimonadota bacterium]
MAVKEKPIKSDLKRIDAMKDEDIDYSDIPEVDAAFFESARVVVPPGKKQVTVRLDSDVLAWLKDQGKGYQTRINAILRAYYDAHAK